MSTRGRTATADVAGDLAGAVREAGFVHLVATADGDALAAAGLLASGCRAADVPFQVNVSRTDDERDRWLAGGTSDAPPASNSERERREPDDLTVLVGDPRGAADRVVSAGEHPASLTAHAVAVALGAEPAPTLALAGGAAAGVHPGEDGTAGLLEAAEETRTVERRPGVALPVEDVVDGLTHQTLVHADFAGDTTSAAELANDAGIEAAAPDGDTDDDARQRLASLVALEVAGDERAAPRAADAVERALHPYATPEGPFATVCGFADVLEATAHEAPGVGIALALDGTAELDGTAGADRIRERALDAWRNHGRAAHAAVRSAATGRYDGLFVVRLDGGTDGEDRVPVGTVARLVLDARSPEPVVLVVNDGQAGAAAVPTVDVDVGDSMRQAVATVGGNAGGDGAHAYATHDAGSAAFVTAFREADPRTGEGVDPRTDEGADP